MKFLHAGWLQWLVERREGEHWVVLCCFALRCVVLRGHGRLTLSLALFAQAVPAARQLSVEVLAQSDVIDGPLYLPYTAALNPAGPAER